MAHRRPIGHATADYRRRMRWRGSDRRLDGAPAPLAALDRGARWRRGVAMIVVAEVAVWILSPREEPLEPVPVAENEYFSPAEIDRATDYRDVQRWLMLAGLAVEGIVLAAVALGRPAPVRRALERLGGPTACWAPRPPARASRC